MPTFAETNRPTATALMKFSKQQGFLTALLLTTNLSAQDVTPIEEVEVRGKRIEKNSQPNAYTNNATMADTAVLGTLQAGTLSDYLSGHSAVFVKESGKGMTSTISMRGTAASQTAVSWNGVAINSLTMGQTDFSQIPLFFFDYAELAPGGESSLYGNGAIGGSVDLRNSIPEKNSFHGSLMQTVGSYGHSFTGLKLQGGGNKVTGKTALFYNRADNDFHFQLQEFGGKTPQLQHNAGYNSYGLQQDLYWQIGKRQQLALNCWHTALNREIQPSVQNNRNPDKYEDISDRNTRALLTYTNNGWATINAKAAYLNDHQEYNNDLIATHDALAGVDAEHEWTHLGWIRQLQVKVGAQAQYIIPEVDAYDDDKDEWRNDVFALANARLAQRWFLNAGLRQQWVSGEDAPVSPSAGIKFGIVEQDSAYLRLKANISRNYRIPTLNDRYWGHLDNKYLKPEDATNYEGGAEWNWQTTHCLLQLAATAFHNEVENWILWMPRGNVWKPINVDLVEVNGAEVNGRFNVWGQTLQAAYTRSHTEVKEGFAEMRPFKGRQIALLPEDHLSASFTGRWKNWKWIFAANYTGERTTSDVFDTMDAYWLCNTSLGYKLLLGRDWSLNLQASINNLLGTDYQTVPYKAMPGRNYQLEARLEF